MGVTSERKMMMKILLTALAAATVVLGVPPYYAGPVHEDWVPRVLDIDFIKQTEFVEEIGQMKQTPAKRSVVDEKMQDTPARRSAPPVALGATGLPQAPPPATYKLPPSDKSANPELYWTPLKRSVVDGSPEVFKMQDTPEKAGQPLLPYNVDFP